MESTNSNSGQRWSHLPILVLENIFKYLPLPALQHASLVNQEWRTIAYKYQFLGLRAFWSDKKEQARFIKLLASSKNILKILNLSYLVVEEEDIELDDSFFDGLGDIEKLILSSSSQAKPISFRSFQKLIKACPNLRELDVKMWTYMDYTLGLWMIRSITPLTQLTKLCLPKLDFEVESWTTLFSNLTKLNHLTSLATSTMLIALMSTNRIVSLKSWNIEAIVADIQTPLVLAFESAINLEEICIHYDVRTYTRDYFIALSLSGKIKGISLYDNDCTPIEVLFQFMHLNKQLERFSIHYHSFKDDGVKFLNETCNQLKHVEFINTHLTTEGFEYLLRNGTNITSVDINLGLIILLGPPFTEGIKLSHCLKFITSFKISISPSLLASIIELIDFMKTLQILVISSINHGDNLKYDSTSILLDGLSNLSQSFTIANFDIYLDHLNQFPNSEPPTILTKSSKQDEEDLVNRIGSTLTQQFPSVRLVQLAIKNGEKRIEYLNKNFPSILFVNRVNYLNY